MKIYEKCSIILKSLILLLFLGNLSLTSVKAQVKFIEVKKPPVLSYDDIPVLLVIEGYGNFYVDIIYTNNDLLYINIQDLFKAIKVPCNLGRNGDSISGFVENENKKYLIDYNNNLIKVGDKTFKSENGLIKEMGFMYMESSLFAEAFGIILTFNYRSLSMFLKSSFELPIIKEMRIEKMRSNISRMKGEESVDTVLQRSYHLFKPGTLDWFLSSVQTDNSSINNNIRLSLGTEFLFGETDITFNYYNQYKFDERQLFYQWKWVDNNNPIIKQAQVGKIYNQTISFISTPVLGAVFRNAPTTIRKANGYYTINDKTEPNWSIELYINDILVDYTKSDASGLFTFKVPIIYGYTVLKLKFYGPMGEERTEERTLNVPYTFMPVNEFEYTLSGGFLQDSNYSRFGKAEFNYGVFRNLTIAGGIEYLSSITSGKNIPYAKASIQPFSNLTLNGEYDYRVRSGGTLNFYFLKSASIELDYTKYVDGQTATLFRYLEEKKARLSLPFRINKLSFMTKLDYTQYVYNTFSYTQSNFTFSAFYKQFNINSSTLLNWIDNNSMYISSNLSLSYLFKNGITLRPSAQYNANTYNLDFIKFTLEKKIPKGFISLNYQKTFTYNQDYFNISFSYDFKAAKTSVGSTYSDKNFSMLENAQGSMAFGGGKNFTNVNNSTSVGKGGILLYPFLDLNNNGTFDKGEPMVQIYFVRVSGGKAIFNEKDTIIRIPDMIAFTSHTITFSDNDLENMNWRFMLKKYQVIVDPNQFKRIDIPVMVLSEVNGKVFIKENNSTKGIARVLIKLYKKDTKKFIKEVLSESDGYYSYLGLAPGEYIACMDSVQMRNLDFTAEPQQKTFTVKTSIDGDIISGIDFVLSRKEKIIIPDNKELEKKEVPKDKK